MNTFSKFSIYTCLLLLGFSVAVGVENNNKDPEKKIEAAQSPIDEKLVKLISIDFVDTPIEDVLRMISQFADIDMIKSPEVTGTVNARLSNVPVGEALENILAVHGFAYIKTNTMLRVVPQSQAVNVAEKITSKVYRITYADVKSVAVAIKGYVSDQGRVSVNVGTSNIAVTDTESRIKAIDQFLEEVDRVTEQVIVEVRIYDISGDSSLNLDVQWNAGTETNNTAGEQVYQTTGAGISYVDELSRGEAPAGTAIQSTKDPFAAASFDKTEGGAIRLGFLNDGFSLDMSLSMLHSEGLAKLLANPRILVLDNETATFEIVEEIPYKEESETSQGGSLTSTQFKDVGIKLEVTPHITRDQMLRMRIVPEFGIAEDQVRNPITQEPIVPTVNTRKLDTIALLRSGQTVVLGGLKRFETTKDYWKAPILGDLPLLAPIFRSESETKTESELLIFIRPIIVPGECKMNKEEEDILESISYPKPEFTGRNLMEIYNSQASEDNE